MAKTGWLSPTGELIGCDGYAHLDKATKIVKYLHLEDTTRQADDILLAYGWVRISRITYGDQGLAFWMPKRISPEQHIFLREIVEKMDEPLSQQGVKALYGYGIY